MIVLMISVRIFTLLVALALSGLSDFVPPVIYDALAKTYMLHLAIGDFKQHTKSMTCGLVVSLFWS